MEPRSAEALRSALEGRVLFPRLRSLSVFDSAMDRLFVNESLQEVIWRFCTLDTEDSGLLLSQMRSLIGMSPCVTSLSLLGACVGDEPDSVISNLCASMPRLQRLFLGPYTLSPVILRALLYHRDLIAIEIVDIDVLYEDRSAYRARPSRWRPMSPDATGASALDVTRITESPNDAQLRPVSDIATPPRLSDVPPSTPSNSFHSTSSDALDVSSGDPLPQLSRFGVAMPNIVAVSWFIGQKLFPLSRLERLHLVLSHPQSVRACEVHDLFASLVATCASLSEVVLQMRLDTENEGSQNASIIQALSFNDLRPLLDLPMVVFDLEHTYPLEITDGEAELLARTWRGLQHLSLVRRPLVLLPSKMSVRAIAAFSVWCPDLRTLGIYVDGGAYIPTVFSDVRRLNSRFSMLYLGLSSFPTDLSDEECACIAYYLRRLLPFTAMMSSGTWEGSIDNPEEFEVDPDGDLSLISPVHLFEYEEGWSRVSELMSRCDTHLVQLASSGPSYHC